MHSFAKAQCRLHLPFCACRHFARPPCFDGVAPFFEYGAKEPVVSNEKSSAKEEIRFNVRITPGLHARITSRAAANGRSMNSEIIALLEKSLDKTGATEFRFLLEEYQRLRRQTEQLREVLADSRDRRVSILQELRVIAAADSEGDLPEDLKQKARELVAAIKQDHGIED
jgi:hypothetical protein